MGDKVDKVVARALAEGAAEVASLQAALDEARASLAATQEALRHEDKARSDAQAEVNRLTASLARVTEEREKAIRLGANALAECARLREEGAALRASIAERARPEGSEAMCAARVSGCTCRWPVTLCASPSCPLHGMEPAPPPEDSGTREATKEKP